jgi:hypothetical protein
MLQGTEAEASLFWAGTRGGVFRTLSKRRASNKKKSGKPLSRFVMEENEGVPSSD